MEALHKVVSLLRLHEADFLQHLGPVLHQLHLLCLRRGRCLLVRRLIAPRRREELVTGDEHGLGKVDRGVAFVHGNADQMRALGDLLVEKPLVLASEHERHRTGLGN